MNLWAHFLLAGLFLSASALTPEECRPLVEPLSLSNLSAVYSRMNFLAGYTDSDMYNNFLKATESSWFTLSPSPSRDDQFLMEEENRINGNCFHSAVNMTIEGNMGTISYVNFTSKFHSLPSCAGCLLLSGNSTIRQVNNFFRFLKVNATSEEEDMTVHALYLMSKETTLKDSDMETFKEQAGCLGFTREPDFIYDPKNDFCAEGTGINMPLPQSEDS